MVNGKPPIQRTQPVIVLIPVDAEAIRVQKNFSLIIAVK